MSAIAPFEPSSFKSSPPKDWIRALERSASIPRQSHRLLSTVLAEEAARDGQAAALLSDRESLTFAEFAARVNQYARWAIKQDLQKGDVVALLMNNQPDYFAIWLGLSSIGCVVALLNTNQVGASLLHSLRITGPKHLIIGSGFLSAVQEVKNELAHDLLLWTHGFSDHDFSRIDFEIENQSKDPLGSTEQRPVTINDIALYIFTSGTTGLPKAANVSHARVLQWAHWFAAMMDMRPSDRIYSCLPMYHSVGGVLVPGAALIAGAGLVIREKFSARNFWSDVVRWDCTIIQYIGEFCRYLLHAPESKQEHTHRVRVACGNGMAGDVWERFQTRFRIPRIFEFYASTEGGISLFNVEGERGSIGRVPPYLAHRISPALVRLDEQTGEPLRNSDGFCLRCGENEVGEALGPMREDTPTAGSRFEGYTDPEATSRKILRDVFRPGDSWVRTGDLMRRDSRGFFYFVDRIGDTFRWKGENVATTEISEAICAFHGVRHAAVYGVTVPFAEGRAGMAALVVNDDFHLAAFRDHLANRLPTYARPLFLRITRRLDMTGTFKHSKNDLARQAYNPGATEDPLYVSDPDTGAWLRIDCAVYRTIQSGGFRW
jgi:fatty-acyl-CoA synthase